MLIGIDFDGTLVVGKEPLPGARRALQSLREQGHKIMIYSCNNAKWIEKVLRDNDMPYDYIFEGTKPICHLYIDDRNITFEGDWDDVLDVIDERGQVPIL